MANFFYRQSIINVVAYYLFVATTVTKDATWRTQEVILGGLTKNSFVLGTSIWNLRAKTIYFTQFMAQDVSTIANKQLKQRKTLWRPQCHRKGLLQCEDDVHVDIVHKGFAHFVSGFIDGLRTICDCEKEAVYLLHGLQRE